MDCKVARKLMSAFIDGELAPDKAATLDEHICICYSCQQELESLKRTTEALGVCTELEPSFTLADIRERAAERRFGNPVFTWLQRMPGLVTAVMVFLAILAGTVPGIYHGSRNSRPTQAHLVLAKQPAFDSFSLDAFDDGLAGAVYVADVGTESAVEVMQ